MGNEPSWFKSPDAELIERGGRLHHKPFDQAKTALSPAHEQRDASTTFNTKVLASLAVLAPESCRDCGLCCEGIGSPMLIYASRPGFPTPHPFRPATLPDELIQEIDCAFSGLLRGQEPQQRCLWFDEQQRGCRHYEFRPPICREYELGGTACQQRRREERRTINLYNLVHENAPAETSDPVP